MEKKLYEHRLHVSVLTEAKYQLSMFQKTRHYNQVVEIPRGHFTEGLEGYKSLQAHVRKIAGLIVNCGNVL